MNKTNSKVVPLYQKPLQQESQEVWEGIELTIETDISISQLHSIFSHNPRHKEGAISHFPNYSVPAYIQETFNKGYKIKPDNS